MRALVVLTVVMGVILVAGTGLLGVLIFNRLSAPSPAVLPLTLDEPSGTHIAEIAAFGDRLALRLEGGGADRVVVVDPARGRVTAHIGLKP